MVAPPHRNTHEPVQACASGSLGKQNRGEGMMNQGHKARNRWGLERNAASTEEPPRRVGTAPALQGPGGDAKAKGAEPTPKTCFAHLGFNQSVPQSCTLPSGIFPQGLPSIASQCSVPFLETPPRLCLLSTTLHDTLLLLPSQSNARRNPKHPSLTGTVVFLSTRTAKESGL